MLTGLRPSTTGVYALAPWFRTAKGFEDAETLFQYFHRHGYTTLTGGKIFHDAYPPDFPSFWHYARLTYLMQLDWLLMTYLFLVGLAHALAYRRESETRALDAGEVTVTSLHARRGGLQRLVDLRGECALSGGEVLVA